MLHTCMRGMYKGSLSVSHCDKTDISKAKLGAMEISAMTRIPLLLSVCNFRCLPFFALQILAGGRRRGRGESNIQDDSLCTHRRTRTQTQRKSSDFWHPHREPAVNYPAISDFPIDL